MRDSPTAGRARAAMAASAIALATPVAAQERDDGVSALAEIVVTAERRETRLIATPLSISALDARAIENHRIVTMDDVSTLTPGVTFVPLTPSATYVSIR